MCVLDIGKVLYIFYIFIFLVMETKYIWLGVKYIIQR